MIVVLFTLLCLVEIRCDVVCDITTYGSMISGITPIPGADYLSAIFQFISGLTCTGEDFARLLKLALEERDIKFIKTAMAGLKKAYDFMMRCPEAERDYPAFAYDIIELDPLFLDEGNLAPEPYILALFGAI